MNSLLVKKIFADARLPVRTNPTDSGADVFVYRFEQIFTSGIQKPDITGNEICLNTNDRVLINTGLIVTVGSGYEIQVRPRSGNAINRGLIVVNSPGTIDESYRGMLGIIIANIGHQAQIITKGDKIAQIVVSEVKLFPVLEVDELNQTERGEKGFGSSDL